MLAILEQVAPYLVGGLLVYMGQALAARQAHKIIDQHKEQL